MRTNLSGIIGLIWLGAVSLAPGGAAGPVPPPEKLLPDDTLMLVTVPDWIAFEATVRQSPAYQFWHDPAMRPFKEKFTTRFKEELLTPLERELGVRFGDYTNLIQGQLTFAITQNGWAGRGEPRPALLLLADTKDKSEQLKKNLAELRKKWSEADRPLKIEKIRDVAFLVLLFGPDDTPKTLKNFFSSEPRFKDLAEAPEAPAEEPPAEARKAKPTSALYIGQAGSLLIVGSAPKPIERVLIALGGGQSPTLADHAVYRANHLSFFREAHLYGWANVKLFVETLLKSFKSGPQPEDERGEEMVRAPHPGKLISAIGLNGLRAACFSLRESSEGSLMQFYLDVPEANRVGLFKILAGDPKEATPPTFVPADVIKFSRWRVDAQKAWATLEQMVNEFMPFGVFTFIFESASAAAKETDPDFDLKKSILANLGDDFISFQKVPRSSEPADLRSPPSVVLIGSAKSEQLVLGLKTLFGAMAQAAGGVEEREFLGKKIYAVQPPFLPGVESGLKPARKLSFAASSGYVAFSADPAALEELLRAEGKGKTLRETPGLTEAAQKVVGPGTTMFEFENQAEQMRTFFALVKHGSDSPTNVLAQLRPLTQAGLGELNDWLDLSLLPPYERVAKYFHFSVSALNTSVEGILLKMFSPVPPQLKKPAE